MICSPDELKQALEDQYHYYHNRKEKELRDVIGNVYELCFGFPALFALRIEAMMKRHDKRTGD